MFASRLVNEIHAFSFFLSSQESFIGLARDEFIWLQAFQSGFNIVLWRDLRDRAGPFASFNLKVTILGELWIHVAFFLYFWIVPLPRCFVISSVKWFRTTNVWKWGSGRWVVVAFRQNALAHSLRVTANRTTVLVALLTGNEPGVVSSITTFICYFSKGSFSIFELQLAVRISNQSSET